MAERRVRVMVGEGQTARKGLLRFVLENEGYDVVAEATSTLELAQRLAIHRPDVVVLDDGIDASAVGMMREVLPSAKVILVWPRGVTAVGSDARLEPSEVMTSLGSTVARVMGRGGVIAPPRPRVPPPDVIVVPEPEPSPVPTVPFEPVAVVAPVATVGAMAPLGPSTFAVEGARDARTEPVVVVPEALPGVMMEPASLAAPRCHDPLDARSRAALDLPIDPHAFRAEGRDRRSESRTGDRSRGVEVLLRGRDAPTGGRVVPFVRDRRRLTPFRTPGALRRLSQWLSDGIDVIERPRVGHGGANEQR